jgi:hypothetical protein
MLDTYADSFLGPEESLVVVFDAVSGLAVDSDAEVFSLEPDSPAFLPE